MLFRIFGENVLFGALQTAAFEHLPVRNCYTVASLPGAEWQAGKIPKFYRVCK
jgi:hypothetical protein